MSLLIPDSGLLVWMLLCFGVVFFVLAKYGFPVITGMVERRKSFIDESLKNAREANEKLADLHAEGERLLSVAREEQAKIMQDAMKSREKIVEQAKEQATLECDKLLADAKRQIQHEKEDALHDIRRQIAELSVGVAEQVLRKQLSDQEQQMELIDRLIKEVKVSES